MYADYTYYTEQYGGTELVEDMLPYLRQASRDVDTLTYGRIRAVGFENLSAFQQEIIQDCCCDLAMFALEHADILEGMLSSYSINSVSLSFDGNSPGVTKVQGIYLPSSAYRNLCQTGLCCQSESGWRRAIP